MVWSVGFPKSWAYIPWEGGGGFVSAFIRARSRESGPDPFKSLNPAARQLQKTLFEHKPLQKPYQKPSPKPKNFRARSPAKPMNFRTRSPDDRLQFGHQRLRELKPPGPHLPQTLNPKPTTLNP